MNRPTILFLCIACGYTRGSMAQTVGFGTATPVEALHVNGNIRCDNSARGVILDAVNAPFITRGWDAFTSGNYSGLGSWGLFLEPFTLTVGIPAISNRNIQMGTYNANSTLQTILMSLLQNGNTGIGTATPNTLLHVYTNADIWHGFVGGVTGQLQLAGQNGGGGVIESWNPKLSQPADLYLQRDGGNAGIGNNAPQQRLDVSGNIALGGPLTLANDAGNGGAVLTSNGSGNSSIWQSSTNALYNQTTHTEGSVDFITSGNGTCTSVSGLINTFTLAGNSQVLVNFSLTLGLGGGFTDADGSIRVLVDGTVAQQYDMIVYSTSGYPSGMHASRLFSLAAGAHTIQLQLCSISGGDIGNQAGTNGITTDGPNFLEIIPIVQ
jgi:hypothetical protein